MSNALPEEDEGPWNDFYTKRIPIVAGILKTNDIPEEVLDKINFDPKVMKVIVAPTDIYLSEARKNLPKKISVMSQSVSGYDEDGCCPLGDICPDMLNNIGINSTLVGHHDKRTSKTSSQDVAKKTKDAVE